MVAVAFVGSSPAQAAQTATFKIDSLSQVPLMAGDTGAQERAGDVRGGIGASLDSVFVRGDAALGVFDINDFSISSQAPGSVSPDEEVLYGWADMFATDLSTAKVWSFDLPDDYDDAAEYTLTTLTALDDETGALTDEQITLSPSISVTPEDNYKSRIFAGYGRIVVVDGTSGVVYDIELPSGEVTQPETLNPETSPLFQEGDDNENSFVWGVAEYFDDELWLDFAGGCTDASQCTAESPGQIIRMDIDTEATETIFTAPEGTGSSGYNYTLGDDPSFVADCVNNEWYLAYEYGDEQDWVSGYLPAVEAYSEPLVSFSASFTAESPCGRESNPPDLGLSIGTAKKVRAGKTFKVGVRVRNRPDSPSVAEAVRTCLTLPKSLYFVSVSGARARVRKACWSRASLAVGSSVTFKARVRALKTASSTRASARLRASVNASGQAGGSASTTASAAVRLLPARAPRPQPPTG